MAKHTIIAARPMQILGHEGDVEAGTVLATIETDCELGSLVSALHFGTAKVDAGDADAGGESPTVSRTSKRRAAAAPAGQASTGAKSAKASTRRR